ncbi:Rep1 protein [Candida orthopsilosis Co 90-125]|uniref:Rep1 protein n=1 Tax=Candida orthopsilosis (strain 90-125) TaxID=1136231 RepID=H8WVE2_CANO9|nr:Rep1 protein [Candida orthopsilosis Co 90-125]CCG20413.1 Rep1 protein [Candida orthopsilosis Co 90-125]
MNSSDRTEDLASLFLPDSLQQTPQAPATPATASTMTERLVDNSNYLLPKENTASTSLPNSSYQDFLNNNNFINRPTGDEQEQQFSHVNHYAPYLPYDANIMTHYQNFHNPMYPYFPEEIQPYGAFQQSESLQRNQQYEMDIPPEEEVREPESPKKKSKGRKRDLKHTLVEIDYKPAKLKKLLDLNPSGATSMNDYKIIDNNNKEVAVEFSGFLNGKFFTNDTDNNNYLFTKNELQKEESKPLEDPKIVSCYRRNYIQVLMNMRLAGVTNDFKLLKLQTSEYGYSTTRVIKYFKIEIQAMTNISNSKSVPIIVRNSEKEVLKQEPKDDVVQPTSIGADHVVVLNESGINNELDKYFVVRKLQFKNATPNNGNLTFQNYYHLKVKLSCVVADIYYDDYVDDIANLNNSGNTNEFLLAELVSEPIIVRGRNPSFYSERKDVLIRCRPYLSKKSYQLATESARDKLEDDDEHVSLESTEDDIDDQLDEGHVSPIDKMKQTNSTNSEIDLNEIDGYKYYPISSHYYLPPVNVVYFPHRAHHPIEKDDYESTVEPVVQRKSSNVYFK